MRQFVVTHAIRQSAVPAWLDSWVTNKPSVKMLCLQKLFFLTFSWKQNMFNCWSIRDLTSFSATSKIIYIYIYIYIYACVWVRIHCCFVNNIQFKNCHLAQCRPREIFKDLGGIYCLQLQRRSLTIEGISSSEHCQTTRRHVLETESYCMNRKSRKTQCNHSHN